MTLQRAYDLLRARWPGRSFEISFEFWHHDLLPNGSAPQDVLEWNIWEAVEQMRYTGPTLEHVMEAALGCDADLDAVQAQIEGCAP